VERDRDALEIFFREVAKDALTQGLRDKLLSSGLEDVLQLSAVISGIGAHLSKSPHDPSLMLPTIQVVQNLLESGYVIVGDVTKKDDESLFVRSWELSSRETGKRIERDWQDLDEPRNLNDIAWLELTDAGRDEARKVTN
jgi:hypothetical protein